MSETRIYSRYLTPEFRKVSEDDRTVEFVASDNSVDSYGTVLPVDKWDLGRYERNGAVGYQHAIYGEDDPDNIIGKGRAFVENDQLIVAVTFEPRDINEKADKIYRKVLFGTLNAVSVGFAPTRDGHWGDKKRGEDPEVYYYDGQELLEVSVVNIPSNSNAVRRSLSKDEAEAMGEKPVEEPEIVPEEPVEAEPEPEERDVDFSELELAKAKAFGAMV